MSSEFFLGYPKKFKDICSIYPPTIKEIVTESSFNLYKSLLCVSQEDILDQEKKKVLDDSVLSPFRYLMKATLTDKRIALLVQKAFKFFTKENVLFLYETNSIVFGNLADIQRIEDLKVLEEEDFFDFQNLLREATGSEPLKPYDSGAHPEVQRMRSLARYRDKIKNKKGGLSLEAILEALCSMGIGITPLNIGELTYTSAIKLFETYSRKEKYDLDVKSLLAGADKNKVKPEYWIKYQS